MERLIRVACRGAVMALFVIPAGLEAQSYPSKPVRLFTGSAPGGGADQTSRVIAEHLSRTLKEQVVVENRPGATGMIANRLVSSADLMFGLIPVSYPYITQGRLRALAVTAKTRNPLLPDTPTIDQAALPGFEVVSWEGVFAHADTPHDIIAKLNSAIGTIVNSPEVKKIWADKGVETVTGTPQELGTRLRQDYERLGNLLEKIGVKK